MGPFQQQHIHIGEVLRLIPALPLFTAHTLKPQHRRTGTELRQHCVQCVVVLLGSPAQISRQRGPPSLLVDLHPWVCRTLARITVDSGFLQRLQVGEAFRSVFPGCKQCLESGAAKDCQPLLIVVLGDTAGVVISGEHVSLQPDHRQRLPQGGSTAGLAGA